MVDRNIKYKNKKTELQELAEIRKAAIKEVKKIEKEGKSIFDNSVEVICTEKDIFHTKDKKR